MTDQTPVQRLIQALRSPLPKGFEWDFRRSNTCALGLAKDMGLDRDAIIDCVGMEPFRSWPPVDSPVPLYRVPARDVTPAMVADALERLVNRENADLERMMLAEV